MTLDSGLSTECADIFGVLRNFHLLDLLTEGGTISGQRFISKVKFISRFRIIECQVEEFVDGRKIIKLQQASLNRGVKRIRTYLVPYLPVTPTFLVLLVIFAVLVLKDGCLFCRCRVEMEFLTGLMMLGML